MLDERRHGAGVSVVIALLLGGPVLTVIWGCGRRVETVELKTGIEVRGTYVKTDSAWKPKVEAVEGVVRQYVVPAVVHDLAKAPQRGTGQFRPSVDRVHVRVSGDRVTFDVRLWWPDSAGFALGVYREEWQSINQVAEAVFARHLRQEERAWQAKTGVEIPQVSSVSLSLEGEKQGTAVVYLGADPEGRDLVRPEASITGDEALGPLNGPVTTLTLYISAADVRTSGRLSYPVADWDKVTSATEWYCVIRVQERAFRIGPLRAILIQSESLGPARASTAPRTPTGSQPPSSTTTPAS